MYKAPVCFITSKCYYSKYKYTSYAFWTQEYAEALSFKQVLYVPHTEGDQDSHSLQTEQPRDWILVGVEIFCTQQDWHGVALTTHPHLAPRLKKE